MAMSRAHQSESLSNNDSSLFTIEEIDTRIQQLLAENSELRNTLQQNNTYMRLLVSTLTEWHNEIDRIHASYHIKCDRAKQMIAELKSENLLLRQKLDWATAKGFISKGEVSATLSQQDIAEHLDSFEFINNESCSFIAQTLDQHNNLNLKQHSLDSATEVKCETGKEVLQDLSNLGDCGKKLHDGKLLTNGSKKITRLHASTSKQNGEMFHSIDNNMNTAQHEHHKLLELEKTNGVLNHHCKELSEKISSLNARLTVAEELVLSKQTQNTELLMEVSRLEQSAEVIPILKAQLELYESDFEAEREARQSLAGEKDALAQELRILKRKIEVLQLNLPSSLMNAHDADASQNPQSYECPKCSFKYSTFDSLNNHLDECLNQQMFPV